MTPKEIKKLLPYGAIKQTAKELGISANTISRVINENYQTRKRNDILNGLVNQILKYQREQAEAEQALQTILNPPTE